jgi:hypothetical protein
MIWDLKSEKQPKQFEWHFNTICSLAFSPDGNVLATASDDHDVKLWSVGGDWKLTVTLPGTEVFRSVAFSPDGKWIVAGGGSGAITVWDAATHLEVRKLTGHTNAVTCLMFSSDGRTLASASWDETVKLWDPVSGREMRTLRGHTEWISCLAFSPDGNTLATGSFDETVRLWDAASAEEIAGTLAADRGIADRIEKRRRASQERRASSGNYPVKSMLLKQYEGDYDDGLIVKPQDDHLAVYTIKGARGAPVHLYPQSETESETEFVCRDREIDVTFLKDGKGQVTRAIVWVEGEAFEAKKLIDSKPVGPTTVKP